MASILNLEQKTYSLIPDIQERIDVLDSLKVDNDFEKDVKENIGKKMYNNLLIENQPGNFPGFNSTAIVPLNHQLHISPGETGTASQISNRSK